ncbi:hypothetical protein EYF80_022157 [Liparis tanakae]|uniref:Uncharacterized protein n=1 Tax=Liparis tanakae TaxID=230148 RepID=A0A4Z2HP47_9TELE|nr:hypothetical protein EYF80_022157 [Liparis tanakae]
MVIVPSTRLPCMHADRIASRGTHISQGRKEPHRQPNRRVNLKASTLKLRHSNFELAPECMMFIIHTLFPDPRVICLSLACLRSAYPIWFYLHHNAPEMSKRTTKPCFITKSGGWRKDGEKYRELERCYTDRNQVKQIKLIKLAVFMAITCDANDKRQQYLACILAKQTRKRHKIKSYNPAGHMQRLPLICAAWLARGRMAEDLTDLQTKTSQSMSWLS